MLQKIVATAVAMSGLLAQACICEKNELPGRYAKSSGPFFDAASVLDVQLEMAFGDYDTLSHESRDIRDIIGPNCAKRSTVSPYTYFPADITVNGFALDQVAVRSKGFMGSINPTRPSLKVDFDRFVPEQSLSGLSRMTFNNNNQDPTRLHSCLAYWFFHEVGLAAPRCSLAHVTVNGETKGIFSHVESIKKPFLRRHFSGDGGLLLEGALSDFAEEQMSTFQIKSDHPINQHQDIMAVVQALDQDDEQLIDALKQVLDLDHFFKYWATEVLIGHWDSYSGNQNNFFLYQDPTDKLFRFIPWGADSVFQKPELPIETKGPLYANSRLTQRLYQHPQGRQRFLKALRQVSQAWDEEEMCRESRRLQAMIEPHVLPEHATDLVDSCAQLRDFFRQQKQEIQQLLQDPPEWDATAGLTPCLQDVGEFALQFNVVYRTDDVPPFFGDGHYRIDFQGVTYSGNLTGVAGPGQQPRDRRLFTLLLNTPIRSGKNLFFYLNLSPSQIRTGIPITIDRVHNLGMLLYLDGLEPIFVGFLSQGQIIFHQYDPTVDAPVVGQFTGKILAQPTADIGDTGCNCSGASAGGSPTAAVFGVVLLVRLASKRRRL